MKQVMTFGTFDVFHKGHENYLRQAREYGSYLITVVARDETVAKIKKKKPANNERERAKKVRESKLADRVVLGNLNDKYAVIKKFQPDVICLGYDQETGLAELKKKLFAFGLKNATIARLKPYRANVYKSSKLKGKKHNVEKPYFSFFMI